VVAAALAGGDQVQNGRVLTPGLARTVCWCRSAAAPGSPFQHPPLRDRHESGPDIRAFNHLDVDAQHRAVDREIMFEAGVEL
jgi:hypothetical protein